MTTVEAFGQQIRHIKERAPAENKTYFDLAQEIPPRPIETEKEYALFLDLVRTIDAFLIKTENEGTLKDSLSARDKAEGLSQYAKMIGELIEHYERTRYPSKAVPEDTLFFLMEQHGLVQIDLKEELGGQSAVSAILQGKRKLNLDQIRRLAARFKVSPLTFIQR